MSVTVRCTIQEALAEYEGNAKERLKNARAAAKRERAKLRQNARVLARLMLVLPNAATLTISSVWCYENPYVSFDRESLPLIRKALGRLHVAHKELRDAEKGIITVHLTAEQYPGIDFTYDRPLSSGCQCRIVEQTSTYKTLVCSVD
jgi:hypothetical protein